MDLRILIDNTSAELFINEGRHTHSSLVFPEPADDRIALFTDGGGATFRGLTITEFDPI